MAGAPEFLKAFRMRLSNLSAGNRLVFLPSCSPRRALDLTMFSQLDGKPAFQLLLRALSHKPVNLCSFADPRLEANNHASIQLLELYRMVEAIQEETGAMDLQIGWPMVEGKLNDGTPVRSPLLLIPVRLNRDKTNWILEPRPEADMDWNRSLLHAIAIHNQIALAEALLETGPGEWGRSEDGFFDPTIFRNELYATLRDQLPVDFNAENFTDELQPIQMVPRKDFIRQKWDGRLRLMPGALLGIFPQADSFLDPDYREMIQLAEAGRTDLLSLDAFFESFANAEKDMDGPLPESRFNLTFPIDPWQEAAIRAVKKKQSLVVEGPPGTGKSQLICNLVSDAMASGQRVLVVSQKRAALEVILQRMGETGLVPFIAQVHDIRGDRRPVYDQIARQVDRVDEYKNELLRSDTILAEREFKVVCYRMDQITEVLETFRSALADDSVCGISAHQLYLSTDRQAPVISLKPYLADLTFDKADTVGSKIMALARHRKVLVADEGSEWWENRVPFINYGQEQIRTITGIIRGFHQRIQVLGADIKEITGHYPDFLQLRFLSEGLPTLSRLRKEIWNDQVTYLNRLAGRLSPGEEIPQDLWLANLQRLAEACFEGEGVECTLEREQLGAFQATLQRARSVRRNVFRWLHWLAFAPDKFLVKRVLVANRLVGKDALERLETKLDNRLNLEHILSKIREADWSFPLPDKYSPSAITDWFTKSREAASSLSLIRSLRGLETILSPSTHDFRNLQRTLAALEAVAIQFQAEYLGWLAWFTPTQLEALAASTARGDMMIHYLERHADRMGAEDDLLAGLTEAEREIIQRLREWSPNAEPEQQVEIFLNSLRMAWIDHLELRSPELRMVSSGVLEQLEEELLDKMTVRQKLGRLMARFRVMERVVENIEVNRLNNRVTYRDLRHQATKKRKVWPLRKSIATFSNEIFRLVPCWLASPESVSALFPLERYFDLVIFDEASQCFAERGLPAIARARQVVVAGDSKQLRPSDLYRVRWETDEDEPDMETESLLELAGRRFRTLRLQGHYRSRLPELVAFSNQHFYRGELRVIPDAKMMTEGGKAIETIHVNGIWEDQTNEAEALRAAELVFSLSQNFPEKEIGVITFNQPQQTKTLDAIEDLFQNHDVSVPSRLMVKNIENVQGDERDIIIFSIGYAPGPDGKMRLNFGSLGLAGGGNRLNVAVTRAREKVYVITSIRASELRVSDAKNEGPRLLKAWLEAAESGGIQTGSEQKQGSLQSIICNAYLPQLEKAGFELLPFDGPMLLFRYHAEPRAVLTDDYDEVAIRFPKYQHAQLGYQLRNLGWSWQMMYARNYWLDREYFREQLLKVRSGSA